MADSIWQRARDRAEHYSTMLEADEDVIRELRQLADWGELLEKTLARKQWTLDEAIGLLRMAQVGMTVQERKRVDRFIRQCALQERPVEGKAGGV
jgi:hypothetical protein